MRYSFDPAKQASNLAKHGLNLADAPKVIESGETVAVEGAPLRRADIASGKLVLRQRAATGAALPNKRRVNIFLDGTVIEHFKLKAGARGYQTLINEALKQAIQADNLETVVRQTIREELRRA